MNGEPAVRGIVVTHARLGEALIEAAEEISGVTEALVAVSNRGTTPRALQDRVAEAVGAGPAVVFVDLAAGSCGFASRAASRSCGRAVVITGVSLPILIDFLFHRDMKLGELAERLVQKGRSNITAAGPERPAPDSVADASRPEPTPDSRDDASRSVSD